MGVERWLTNAVEDYRRSEKEHDTNESPPADNEIRCTQSGKITRYVDVGLQKFKVRCLPGCFMIRLLT